MNAPAAPIAEEVVLRFGEATITVPGEAAAMAYLERLLDERRPVALRVHEMPGLPRIGEAWQGGIYAGITVHENQPMALILLQTDVEDVTWQRAKEWAASQGGELPSRLDQLILFQNLKSEFKEAVYWSGPQCAGNDAYAWSQNFSYGDQDFWRKGSGFRARAVRRSPIQ